MTQLLAIDPGNTESAYVVIDPTDCRPIHFAKVSNLDLIGHIVYNFVGPTYIEMIASYGMPVGAEVFETCVWIGRFAQMHAEVTGELPELVKRQPVKLHHCHSSKATDANVTQALRDRFAYGQPNYGKGSKIDPGWFYGFHSDIWQAYALAVYAADMTAPTRIETLAVAGELL